MILDRTQELGARGLGSRNTGVRSSRPVFLEPNASHRMVEESSGIPFFEVGAKICRRVGMTFAQPERFGVWPLGARARLIRDMALDMRRVLAKGGVRRVSPTYVMAIAQEVWNASLGEKHILRLLLLRVFLQVSRGPWLRYTVG